MKIIAAFFLFWSLAVFADESPKENMQLLLQDIKGLEKYLLSEKEFSDPANKGQISKVLGNMSQHVGSMERDKELFKDNPALQINLKMLNQHMQETRDYFAKGNSSFAYIMARNSLQMCASCHSSTGRGPDLSSVFGEREASTVEEADFLFATRQYTNAEKAYRKLIGGYPKNGITRVQVQNALLNLAVYYARVRMDPEEATLYFRALSSKPELPKYLKDDLKTWATSFNRWSNERSKKVKGMDLLKAAKHLLAKDDFSLVESDRKFHVKRLRASALLHQFLEEPAGPSQAKGEALHLLGLIYSRINHNFFFRFGEMYLEACIREYPKTKIARGCYDSLEQITVEGFTGSSGVNIPTDEEEHLERLKKLAY